MTVGKLGREECHRQAELPVTASDLPSSGNDQDGHCHKRVTCMSQASSQVPSQRNLFRPKEIGRVSQVSHAFTNSTHIGDSKDE
jgi:hypothetical protein